MQGERLAKTQGRRWLLTAATPLELDPLQAALAGHDGLDFLVCGVGPVAAAATLAALLARPETGQQYAGVIIGGVAGVYPVWAPDAANAVGASAATELQYPARLLDICLADREILGDFGIAAPHGAEPFTGSHLDAVSQFPLDLNLLDRAAAILTIQQIPFHCGPFVTVNAATATLERGLAISRRHGGLCENMEGAAAALVCRRFSLPLLEIRCISNLVEDRDPARWQLAQAVARNAAVLAALVPAIIGEKVSEYRTPYSAGPHEGPGDRLSKEPQADE